MFWMKNIKALYFKLIINRSHLEIIKSESKFQCEHSSVHKRVNKCNERGKKGEILNNNQDC